MKIKTQKDIDALAAKIQTELDIDITKYRNEEVAETLLDLVLFPKYILNWTIRPILLAILLYILGYYFLNLVHIEYLLYAVIGLFLFLICGLFAGFFFLLWKMRKDISAIITYSLEIMKSCVQDINQTRASVTPENKQYKYSLLFKGIIHVITIPTITNALANKIPFVGMFVKGFIKRILRTVANVFQFGSKQGTVSTKNSNPSVVTSEEKETVAKEQDIQSIDEHIQSVNSFTSSVFRITQFPIFVLLLISLCLLLGFISLIN